MPLSIYIHIPFCLKKCVYCDFASSALDAVPSDEYSECVTGEMRLVSESLQLSEKRVGRIYFGGVTPSLLSAENIGWMIDEARALFDVAPDAEITLEVNPKTADERKLREFKSVGVNRLSIGAQSFDDDLLHSLGRAHNSREAVEVYEAARAAGFDNISVDIMFGIPGESEKALMDDLKALTDLAPEHISAYSLTVEEGTPLNALVNSGKVVMPSEDTLADMFSAVEKYLRERGYKHYEISNYARPDKESVHNLNYWHYGNYIGFGAAAHSLLRGENAARWSNTPDREEYMRNVIDGLLPEVSREWLEKPQQQNEFLIMGLRMLDGIKIDRLTAEFAMSENDISAKFAPLIEQGLLEKSITSLKLTKKGVLLLNDVLLELI